MLYISAETFKNDKIAYIFETNANIATQFSEQLSREVQIVNQSLILYLDRFSKTEIALSDNPADRIPESSVLSAVQIFNLKNNTEPLSANSTNLISSIKKDGVNLINADHPQLSKALAQLGTKKNDFFYSKDLLYFLQQFKIGDNKYVAVYFYESEILNSFFGSESSYRSFLLNASGEVLLKDSVSSADFLSANFSSFLKSGQYSPNTSSTLKIKSDSQETWLLTTTQTPLTDLKLIILVNEKDALAVLNEVVLKSVLIFIILLAIVVIVGIISANYITSRLYLLSQNTRKVAEGDFSAIIAPKGNDEVTELTRHFNKMTEELNRLMLATANKARMEGELKTAQAVQETLLPKNEYTSDKIEIRGHYQSASECGGDWWSYTESKDNIYLWIADATGHGASAALLTSAAKASVTLIEDMSLTPIENIKILNKAICSVSNQKIMMTCFHAMYNKETQTLIYVNASHEPPILFKKDSETYTKSNLIFLNENVNSRLGYALSTEYTSSECQLGLGDRLYFYTDGVQDIANPKGKSFGERGHIKNLVQTLNENTDLGSTTQNFVNILEKFREQTELIDDVTFFFVETK